MMVDRIRPMLAAFACGGLLAAGGCMRTSDGSIEFRPLGSAPGLLSSEPLAVAAFPPVPPIPASERPRKAPRKKTTPAKRQTAVQTELAQAEPAAAPAASLFCHDVTQPSGRVKVVCE